MGTINPKLRSIPIQSHITIQSDSEKTPRTKSFRGIAKANNLCTMLLDSGRDVETEIINELRKRKLNKTQSAILQAVETFVLNRDFNALTKAVALFQPEELSEFTDLWLVADEGLTRDVSNDWVTVMHYVSLSNSNEVPNVLSASAGLKSNIKSLVKKIQAESDKLFLKSNVGLFSSIITRETLISKKNLTQPIKNNSNNTPNNITIGVIEGFYLNEEDIKERFRQRRTYMRQLMENLRLEPLGILSLECLDFIPEGYIRGELVYSLPLTPGEETRVTHREWVSTKSDFMNQISDTIEEENAKELADKVELAESTMQEKSIAHKAYASAEVGYQGPVTVSIKGGYDYENNMTSAAKKSTERCHELTTKSASRSKTESKITFAMSQETGREELNERLIRNVSDTPVRWDFHNLLKKWRIEHWRIDERLTYEIVIPEPGLALLFKHYRLSQLNNELRTGGAFKLSPHEITRSRINELEAQYSATLEPFPDQPLTLVFEDVVDYPGNPVDSYKTAPELIFPSGYAISDVKNAIDDFSEVLYKDPSNTAGPRVEIRPLLEENKNAARGKNAHRHVWRYTFYGDASGLTARPVITYTAIPTATAIESWQKLMHTRLKEAHEQQWIIKTEQLRAQVDSLLTELQRDSLSLRQLEREEIMKNVYRWAFGPDFRFFPGEDELDIDGFYTAEGSVALSQSQQETLAEYSEMAAMLDQAIEWEYVNWVLYPYFWSHPKTWSFKLWLKHNDFYHQQFLRAGCARVRITIRPEWEDAWLKLVEGTADLSSLPSAGIVETLRARAMTLYNYTPNPNREELTRVGTHLDTWWEYTPTGALDISQGAVLDNE